MDTITLVIAGLILVGIIIAVVFGKPEGGPPFKPPW